MAVRFVRPHQRDCVQDQTKCTFGRGRAELHTSEETEIFVLSERDKGVGKGRMDSIRVWTSLNTAAIESACCKTETLHY